MVGGPLLTKGYVAFLEARLLRLRFVSAGPGPVKLMVDTFAVGGLIALCCVLLPSSGWWLAARLRNDGLFRFIAACLAGVTILAAAELTVYVLRLPQAVAAGMVACACAASLRPMTQAIRRREFAWDALLTWAGASAILAAATLRYAVHGLPHAYWDWYEHWLRALIFLKHAPVTAQLATYTMPSRGPLLNASAALLLQLAGSAHYWVFQIFASTLNAVVCLPLALLLRTIGGVSRRTALLIAAAVVVLVPFFFWNNTFTWTKDLTAAFILVGIHEYLVSYREGRYDGMAMSLAYLAPAFLCHYLTLLYAVMMGVHLLLVIPLRTLPVRALMRAGSIWILLIWPWFCFMILNFGVQGTFAANTTVGTYYAAKDDRGRQVALPRVFIANLCVDLLPKSACRPLLPPPDPVSCLGVTVDRAGHVRSEQPCPDAWGWNDAWFAWSGIYGLVRYSGLLVVLVAAAVSARPLWRFFRTPGQAAAGQADSRAAWFLLWVLSAGLVLNLLPVRWFDPWGSFSENLHAWIFVFLAVVVRGLVRVPRAAIAVLVLAMAVEFGMADLKFIQVQSVTLPLANQEQALRGLHPLDMNAWLPVVVAGSGFQAPKDYYENYRLKIKGGAIYFRDMHPDSFAAVSWMILASGIFAVTAGQCLAGAAVSRSHSHTGWLSAGFCST
jgi:hypothetical protein